MVPSGSHDRLMQAFSFVFTRDLYNTHYITYFKAHSFYVCLAPPIVVGVLLICQSLDPEYKTTAFFSDVFPRKKTSSYIRVNTVYNDLRITYVSNLSRHL